MAFTAFANTTKAVDAPPKKTGKLALILLAPGLAYLGLFFLTPFISLIITSLQAPDIFGDIGDYIYAFQWQNYVTVIQEYGGHFIRSFFYAVTATIAALLIGYPIAYFIGVTARNWPVIQALALILVIAPFFISFLLRTLAWKQIFSDDSPTMTFLKSISLVGPDAQFQGSDFAVIFGLTYNFLPFMILPIYTSLERLDLRLLEAGSDLYAKPAVSFWKITVPLSLPGVVSGVLLTFIPASGDFINASSEFLGGPGTQMVGNAIQSNFLILNDYPAAAALSILLMGLILIFVSIYVKRSGTEDLL
jgi:spermidine/putrescine transport system permease protein